MYVYNLPYSYFDIWYCRIIRWWQLSERWRCRPSCPWRWRWRWWRKPRHAGKGHNMCLWLYSKLAQAHSLVCFACQSQQVLDSYSFRIVPRSRALFCPFSVILSCYFSVSLSMYFCIFKTYDTFFILYVIFFLLISAFLCVSINFCLECTCIIMQYPSSTFCPPGGTKHWGGGLTQKAKSHPPPPRTHTIHTRTHGPRSSPWAIQYPIVCSNNRRSVRLSYLSTAIYNSLR